MIYYVEIFETKRYSVSVDGSSKSDAEHRAAELHKSGELPCEIIDRETLVVRHPIEEQHAA